MALETNTPQLTLEHMSLGSQERLEAGLRAGIARNKTGGLSNYSLCLFAGRRPTPEEIERGVFFMLGDSADTQLCGVYNISVNDYIELSSEDTSTLDGVPINDTSVMARKNRPANVSDFIDTDGSVLYHHKFRKFNEIEARTGISQSSIDLVKLLGNGAAPTWALMSPWGSRVYWYDFLRERSTTDSPKVFQRHDGKSIKLTPYAASPYAAHYLTVGDIVDEPTANLVLSKGAERGQLLKPSSISIHRLRYALPKKKTAPISLTGG